MRPVYSRALRLLRDMEPRQPYDIQQLADMSGLEVNGTALSNALDFLRGAGFVQTSNSRRFFRYTRSSHPSSGYPQVQTKRCSTDGCQVQTTRHTCCYCTWR